MSISGKINRLGDIGFKNAVVGGVRACRYAYLARRFGFDPWHAGAPFEWRPYKGEVVALAESVSPLCVMEVGCGLGEILSRVSCERRIGVDVDQYVVQCARFLHGNNCVFYSGSLRQVDQIGRGLGVQVDMLILVNWPHGVAWSEFSALMRQAVQVLGVRYLLIDVIRPGMKGYAFHHKESDVATLGHIVRMVPAADGVRQLFLIDTHHGSRNPRTT